ncbi:hypothetical protein [Streptomyces sp. NBC_01589]|uniref:hypothetical protein n=1 Tax=unclassified Streptomyces TaxID=2593676 RepID=UPI003869F316
MSQDSLLLTAQGTMQAFRHRKEMKLGAVQASPERPARGDLWTVAATGRAD